MSDWIWLLFVVGMGIGAYRVGYAQGRNQRKAS